MHKKLVLVGMVAALLVGCDDGVDAPEYVKTAQRDLNTQMDLYVEMDLPCYRQQFDSRWLVLCFDKNKPVVSPKALYEVVEAPSRPDHYVIQPANGKAAQYGDRFQPAYASYAYDEAYAPEIDRDAVFSLFSKTYPPEK